MSIENEVKGTLSEMLGWMKENGVESENINEFSQKVNAQADVKAERGMAKNCTRSVTGACGEDKLLYTITCCTTFEDGSQVCDSTTVCR